LKNNIIIKQYIGDNTWTLERNNKIHIKKSKVRESYKEGTQRGSIVQKQPKHMTKHSYKNSQSVQHPPQCKKISKGFNNHKSDKRNQNNTLSLKLFLQVITNPYETIHIVI